MFNENIDVKENNVFKIDNELLSILLKDNSSNKNILWATDTYKKYGTGFSEKDYITTEKVTGYYGNVVKPRTKKTKEERELRIRNKAEVFTPSWMCNIQNNEVDKCWLDENSYFNIEKKESWKSSNKKIKFKDGKNWIDYIKAIRLEISCGEAPYLVSRYDAVTGDIIPIKDRIGLLDRKLRVLSENTSEEKEWVEMSFLAYKSIYGFDWQGDNVLIARENLLYSFVDYYKEKFSKIPNIEILREIAHIISWNIWQMDGVKYVIPNSCKNERIIDYTLFGTEETIIECSGCKKNSLLNHNGIYCKVMNWESNRTNKFINLVNRGKKK